MAVEMWVGFYRQESLRNISPIVKRTGDIAWRLAHMVLPSNVSLHRLNEINTEACPFCMLSEDLFHAYVDRARLTSLFELLSPLLHRMNFSFSTRFYFYEIPLGCKRNSETALVNFLISIAKLAIYKTRQEKQGSLQMLIFYVM